MIMFCPCRLSSHEASSKDGFSRSDTFKNEVSVRKSHGGEGTKVEAAVEILRTIIIYS
jgi:hypothetical protein